MCVVSVYGCICAVAIFKCSPKFPLFVFCHAGRGLEAGYWVELSYSVSVLRVVSCLLVRGSMYVCGSLDLLPTHLGMIPQHHAIQLKSVSSNACALLWIFAGRIGAIPAVCTCSSVMDLRASDFDT